MLNGIDLSKPLPINACFSCSRAKMYIEPHQDKIEPGQFLLDLIYSDVSGPYPPSCSGAKYYVTFLDDYDKTSEVVLLSSKDGVLSAFDLFRKRNQFGEARIRRLRTDGGGEYDSHAFEDYREEHGIIWEATVPGNPQMNGAAERLGQTLHGMASAMLKESNLPMKYWSELILTSNYLRNRLPVVGRAITPYEARTKHKPCLQHLRRIGQSGFTQNRKPYTGWKHFQDRSTKGILVGYEGEHIYRMLMPNGQIMRYSNVDWTDNSPIKDKSSTETVQPCHITKGNAKNGLLDISQESQNTATSEDILIPIDFSRSQQHNPPILSESPTTSLPLSSTRLLPTPPEHASNSQQPSVVFLTEQRLTRAQAKSKNIIIAPLSSYPAIEDTSTLLFMLANRNNPEPYEPKSYKQAISDHCKHHEDWQKAMQDEIDSLTENNTWSLSTLPSGSQALQGKWVYKIKRGPTGEILRFKARWVVKGFSQREGIDYNETFASVVKPMSYKAIFALCAARDWDIDHMDIKTAFLYGLVKEIIYVIQPTDYSDGFTRVCKL